MSEDERDVYERGQRWGDLDWGDWRPTTAQRVTAGFFLVAWTLLEANYRLKWGLLGDWGGTACAVIVVPGAVMLLRMLPASLRRRE
jgi:hypothetical protein